MSFDADTFWNDFFGRLQKRFLNEAWCYWFVGFIEGEGSFTYNIHRSGGDEYVVPEFFIGLQHDTPLMYQLQEIIGIGKIYRIKLKTKRRDGRDFAPRVSLSARTKISLQSLTCFFDRYGLRSKKSEEYSIWRLMVAEYVSAGGKSPKLRELAIALSKTNQKKKGQTLSAQTKLS
jgi:hypothetical protein